jgi:hypothetical protein
MAKIVYNGCYGGFGLSEEAKARYAELTGGSADFYDWNLSRHDPALVQVVEELGDAASGFCGQLMIEEIEGSLYRIDEDDGNESVQTPDDIDWIQI